MALESLVFLPGLFLLILANQTEKNKKYLLVTKVFLFLSILLVILNGFLTVEMSGLDALSQFGNTIAYGYSMVATGFLALLLFLKPIREAISNVIDVNADNWLHTTALVFAILLAGISLSTATFTDVIKISQDSGVGVDGILIQDAIFVFVAFFGVGWIIRRDLASAAKRLGIVKPSPKDILYSIVFLIVLFFFVFLASLISNIFGIGPSHIDDSTTDPTILILGEITLIKALLISIGAGVGEETLFRGALQPRFGMYLTSILFVVMHVQYPDPFSMILLFVMSMVFAYERKFLNTTSCVITHTLYDLVMLSAVALV